MKGTLLHIDLHLGATLGTPSFLRDRILPDENERKNGGTKPNAQRLFDEAKGCKYHRPQVLRLESLV